jgi:hypothetical protein
LFCTILAGKILGGHFSDPPLKRKYSRPPDWVLDLENDGIRLILHNSGWKNTGGSFSDSFGMILGGPKPALTRCALLVEKSPCLKN